MPNTTRRALPYPSMTDAANGPDGFQDLAEALDHVAKDITQGTTLPGSGAAGDYFWKTDTNELHRHNGTSWVKVLPGAGTVTHTMVAAANKDGLTTTASMRTLGTGAQQALPGDHASTTNSRPPNGAASGGLAGNYPAPTLAAGSVTHDTVAAANKDGADATPSMRTLGATAGKAASGVSLAAHEALNSKAHIIPTVSALPTTGLVDGMVVHYHDPAGNLNMGLYGIVWTFRYRAGATSPNKWEFIGGSALYSWSQDSATIAHNTFVDINLDLPANLTGWFYVDIAVVTEGPSGAGYRLIPNSYSTRITEYGMRMVHASAGADGISTGTWRNVVQLAASASLGLEVYGPAMSGTYYLRERSITVTPIRVSAV